jgi:hypothetical protein
MNFGEMWLSFGQGLYGYDKNFTKVSEYTKENIESIKNNNN